MKLKTVHVSRKCRLILKLKDTMNAQSSKNKVIWRRVRDNTGVSGKF